MGTKMFRKAAFGYNKKDVCSYIEDIISSVNKELKAKDSEIQSLRQEIRMLQSECGRLNDCLRTDLHIQTADSRPFAYDDVREELKKNQSSVKISLPLQDPLKKIIDKKMLNQQSVAKNSERAVCKKPQPPFNETSDNFSFNGIYAKSTDNLSDGEMDRLKQKMEIMKKLAAKAARRFEDDLNSIEQI